MFRILLPVSPYRRYHSTSGDPPTRAAFNLALLLLPALLSGQTSQSHPPPNLALRLQPGKLVDGFPTSFTFIITNITHHDVRMPKPSNCGSSETGTVDLRVSETSRPDSGMGGGCGSGTTDLPPMRIQAKSWPVLRPDHSLRVTFSSQELFFYDHAPATYVFSAEYTPPVIPSYDQQALTAEGIDFPRSPLTSPHLIFVKKH
jgi:hypothetical protein